MLTALVDRAPPRPRASTRSGRTRPRRSTRCAPARNVVVATGTASGKSLCYQLPIVDVGRRGPPRHRAADLPDQGAGAGPAALAARRGSSPACAPSTYDGDTATDDRAWVAQERQRRAHQPRDAAHGHPARRTSGGPRSSCACATSSSTSCTRCAASSAATSRTCCAGCAGSASTTARDPTFCFASATIGNPAELASRAVRAAGRSRSTTTARRGPSACSRCWQRPLLDAHSGHARVGERRDRRAAVALRRAPGTRRSRSRAAGAAPSSSRSTRAGASPTSTPELADRVAAYRAGYLPDGAARARARARRAASSLGVAATNALELGIDVGGLDAVVLNGFPGTLASMWQQAGRAGRTGRRSAAVLVAGDDQLDQWYAAPSRRAARPSARARGGEPAEPVRRSRAQLACAAHELPLTPDDERWFGAGLDDAVRELVLDDLLTPRGGHDVLVRARAAGGAASGCARGSSVEYQLVDADERTHDRHRRRRARVRGRASGRDLPAPGSAVPRRPSSTSTTTSRCSSRTTTPTSTPRPRTETDIAIVDDGAVGAASAPAIVHLGAVEVRNQVVAYQRKQISTNERDRGRARSTCPPRDARRRARAGTRSRSSVLEAAGHRRRRRSSARCTRPSTALIGMLPLFTICDRWDVGGVSMAMHPQTGEPTIFVYDGYPGGAGIAELAFDAADAPRARRRSSSSRVPVRRRVPVVRAVAEVRQLERVPRQGRGDRAARGARRGRSSAASPTSTSRPSRFRRMTRNRGSRWWCSSSSASGCWSRWWRSRGATTRRQRRRRPCTTRATRSTVAVGEEFVVALPATPSTGYVWTAAGNPDVTFVSTHQVAGGSQPGAEGTQEMTFRDARRASRNSIFTYARSFEKTDPPAKTAKLPADGHEVARQQPGRSTTHSGRTSALALPRAGPNTEAHAGRSTSTTTAALVPAQSHDTSRASLLAAVRSAAAPGRRRHRHRAPGGRRRRARRRRPPTPPGRGRPARLRGGPRPSPARGRRPAPPASRMLHPASLVSPCRAGHFSTRMTEVACRSGSGKSTPTSGRSVTDV